MVRPHPRFFLQSLLLVLVLTMQLFVLAHESAHGLSAESDQCWVCLHGPAFEASAPPAEALTLPALRALACSQQYAPALISSAWRSRRARGPPPSPAVV